MKSVWAILRKLANSVHPELVEGCLSIEQNRRKSHE